MHIILVNSIVKPVHSLQVCGLTFVCFMGTLPSTHDSHFIEVFQIQLFLLIYSNHSVRISPLQFLMGNAYYIHNSLWQLDEKS